MINLCADEFSEDLHSWKIDTESPQQSNARTLKDCSKHVDSQRQKEARLDDNTNVIRSSQN